VSAIYPQNQSSRPVLPSSEASTRYGLSRSHILYLVRTGRIEGTKPGGHDWMIYEDSLQAFLEQSRTPGRKGPHGPRRKRQVRHTEQGDQVLISTAEAQELTGYARDTMLRLLRSGRIEGEKSGREWLIDEDSLLAYKHRKHPVDESTHIESVEPSLRPDASSQD
jgi:excisionase family DNA binding protein